MLHYAAQLRFQYLIGEGFSKERVFSPFEEKETSFIG